MPLGAHAATERMCSMSLCSTGVDKNARVEPRVDPLSTEFKVSNIFIIKVYLYFINHLGSHGPLEPESGSYLAVIR